MQQLFVILEALGRLAIDPLTGALFALLSIAAVSDFRTYRIPNWLTLTGAIYGLACNALLQASPFQGALWALQGMLLCFVIALPFYILRSMGAGDLKLIAMVGAFLGPQAAFAAVLCMFVAGGVAALVLALSHRALGQLLRNMSGMLQNILLSVSFRLMPQVQLDASQSIGRLPFGISIGMGTVGYVVARTLGLF